MSARYDRPSIGRALKFHTISTPGFTFHDEGVPGRPGEAASSDSFRVTIRDEVLNLTPREAWILALGLAAGRDAGIIVGESR